MILLKILLFLSSGYLSKGDDDDDYPKIQSLFKIPGIDKFEMAGRRSYNVSGRRAGKALGVTVDIQKIDVEKLRRKIDQMPRDEAARLWSLSGKINRPFNTTGNETLPLNDTRRLQVAWIPWGAYDFSYSTMSGFATKLKLADISLQTIYMARHKITHLEKEKHFNRKDTGYRIAFIYKHLRRLYRRLVDIYMTTKKNLDLKESSSWKDSEHMTNMHQRATRVYVDFLYYYWVMIEIDKQYRESIKYKEPKGPDLVDIPSTTDVFLNYRGFENWRIWYRK